MSCLLCRHPQRAAIDLECARGVESRSIADRFKVSLSTAWRHRESHVHELAAKAHDVEEAASGDAILEELAHLRARASHALDLAEAANDVPSMIGAIRELRRLVEFLAELEQRISRAPQVNILISPQWIEVREVVFDVLAPYPDVRATLAERLQALS